jgi:MoaA/NifB/PqqE/SkfB family radical SAM enzyme
MSTKRIRFKYHEKDFYKNETKPHELWINKEVLVQLNITPSCKMKCEFCYIRKKYTSELPLEKIYKLWKNLGMYSKKLGIKYRVNLTGGDIFEYSRLEELLKFLSKEKSIIAVDPLLNRFWKEEDRRLLKIIKDKVAYVQLNTEVVQDSDVDFVVNNLRKKALLKYALYSGKTKKNLKKINYFLKKYNNVIVSFDVVIPQKNSHCNKLCLIDNLNHMMKLYRNVSKKLKTDKKNIWFLNCTLEREIYNRTYLCGVGIQNIYVMPNGDIVPCSRYPHLKTGYNVNNFDLIDYFKKFNKLVSNFCLFENKYFSDYWDKNENPINFR